MSDSYKLVSNDLFLKLLEFHQSKNNLCHDYTSDLACVNSCTVTDFNTTAIGVNMIQSCINQIHQLSDIDMKLIDTIDRETFAKIEEQKNKVIFDLLSLQSIYKAARKFELVTCLPSATKSKPKRYKNYVCKTCLKSYSTKSNLNRHCSHYCKP